MFWFISASNICLKPAPDAIEATYTTTPPFGVHDIADSLHLKNGCFLGEYAMKAIIMSLVFYYVIYHIVDNQCFNTVFL